MGDATNQGDSQNFFQTQRNDIPAAPAEPTNLQRDAYTDFVPARQPQQPPEQAAVNGAPGGFVTIQDGNDTFYVPAGSKVIIRHNGDAQITRVGNGANSYAANYSDTMAQVNASRQAQIAAANPRPYYGDSYQNVNGAGYEVPQPIYQPYRPNPVAQFLGALGGAFLGGRFGGGGYGRHGGYYSPGPPFIPHRPGIMIGAQIGPSWQAQNYNYYSQGGYYNQAAAYNQGAAYNPTQYDANGNPVYYS